MFNRELGWYHERSSRPYGKSFFVCLNEKELGYGRK